MQRTPADALATRTRLSPTWALAVVVIVMVLLAGAGWLFGYTLVEQMTSLVQKVPEIAGQFRDRLSEYGLALPDPSQWLSGSGGFLGRGFSMLAATFGVKANFVVAFFVGVFRDPDLAAHAGVLLGALGVMLATPLAPAGWCGYACSTWRTARKARRRHGPGNAPNRLLIGANIVLAHDLAPAPQLFGQAGAELIWRAGLGKAAVHPFTGSDQVRPDCLCPLRNNIAAAGRCTNPDHAM